MGCYSSVPTTNTEEDKPLPDYTEIKSPFYIKEAFNSIEKTPGGTKTKVKKYRKRLVPRLKSIDSSNLILKRKSSFSLSSINSSSEISPRSSHNISSPTYDGRYNNGTTATFIKLF